ncbi:Legume lectin domain [Dillenia turbinata]|uniref:non-specific serine/threonine protein kinase n=1 Tax=Dillenia turbinata TaxID=194707 RepID=A0AAN8ZT16_9MAGN
MLTFSILMISNATSLSFDIPQLTPNDRNINFTGSAYVSDSGIQLTPNERGESRYGKAGRATYKQSMHLWDKASGSLSDFNTNFSFIIDSEEDPNYGDGIAFFLAPNGSDIPNGAAGSALGLTSGKQMFNTTANCFVAVEFDTFSNYWDPEFSHVGININSLISVANTTWRASIMDGKTNDVYISYNSSSKNLTVIFTGYTLNIKYEQSLSQIIDLSLYLPEYVGFGFSAATGKLFERNSINSWAFNSSLQVERHGVSPPPPVAATPMTQAPPAIFITGRHSRGTVVGISAGMGALVSGTGLVWIGLWWKRKVTQREDETVLGISLDCEFEKGTGPRRFSYDELARATKNFAEKGKLGQGGFGGVYKGLLPNPRTYIAVKKVAKGSKQGLKEYIAEIKIISQVRHRNLVQLIGWCHKKEELLLVYEFMPNGSLDTHLFKGKTLLAWPLRYKIAQGLASALFYLHKGCDQCVVHRDIKSSNVMLDSTFDAKLGDFGLARLVDHGKASDTTILAGTIGYMAPECAITGKASKESDVYSFGVVCLEIACGRRAMNPTEANGRLRLVEWVWELYGIQNLKEAADPKLREEFDEKQMERLIIVGLWCAQPDGNIRPSIHQVISVLNFEAESPKLPPTMPVATYLPHPAGQIQSPP